MGYKQLIDSKVNLAFNLLKDLAVEATLTKKTGQSFDFVNLTVSATETPLVVKVIETDSKKPKSKDQKNSSNLTVKQLMVKTADVGDLKTVETFTISGVVWKVSEIQKNDGFISIVDVVREV